MSVKLNAPATWIRNHLQSSEKQRRRRQGGVGSGGTCPSQAHGGSHERLCTGSHESRRHLLNFTTSSSKQYTIGSGHSRGSSLAESGGGGGGGGESAMYFTTSLLGSSTTGYRLKNWNSYKFQRSPRRVAAAVVRTFSEDDVAEASNTGETSSCIRQNKKPHSSKIRAKATSSPNKESAENQVPSSPARSSSGTKKKSKSGNRTSSKHETRIIVSQFSTSSLCPAGSAFTSTPTSSPEVSAEHASSSSSVERNISDVATDTPFLCEPAPVTSCDVLTSSNYPSSSQPPGAFHQSPTPQCPSSISQQTPLLPMNADSSRSSQPPPSKPAKPKPAPEEPSSGISPATNSAPSHRKAPLERKSQSKEAPPTLANGTREQACCSWWTSCCFCTLVSPIDVEQWGRSFDSLMQHSVGRKVFHKFLKLEFSEENILFWLSCQELKSEHCRDAIEEKARSIYEQYISILSPSEVSLDSRVRDIVNANMINPSKTTFDEAQLQVYTLMQRDSYPRFLNSAVYRDFLRNSHAKQQIQSSDSGSKGVPSS